MNIKNGEINIEIFYNIMSMDNGCNVEFTIIICIYSLKSW